MKFYLDADLSTGIAALLRRRGFDAVSAQEVRTERLSDPEALAFAASQGRCLVTRNARHFIVQSQESVRRHRPHAGIIVCPPSILGHEIRAIRLARIAERYPKGLGSYDLIYLT